MIGWLISFVIVISIICGYKLLDWLSWYAPVIRDFILAIILLGFATAIIHWIFFS